LPPSPNNARGIFCLFFQVVGARPLANENFWAILLQEVFSAMKDLANPRLIKLRACLTIRRGPAARDFGGGQGGKFRASPKRAVRNQPTPDTGKRPAARRVFVQKAVWLRCSSVEDPRGIFSFVAPCHPAFCPKTEPFGIFRQALEGILFLLIGLMAAALLVLDQSDLKTAALLAIAIWCFCRFYYFAFYVIEHYVDPGFRFSGLWSFARYMLKIKKRSRNKV
jgi:hypothetical protein